MGSVCPPWLCFLLLSLSALHPGIAAPRADLAVGTNGFSSGQTTVTVYHCKDYGRKSCKLASYEDFEIIGETQNETFSNEIIQLVTHETHITMCFQQEISYPKGVYAIFWEKAWGAGESCGILKFGDSLEYRRHSITEEGKTCCEAQTQREVPDNVLKCYIAMKDETQRNSIGDITDEGNLGNPQYSVSKNGRVGITTLVITLGIFVAAALSLYCVWQTRNRQEPVIVLHQTSSG